VRYYSATRDERRSNDLRAERTFNAEIAEIAEKDVLPAKTRKCAKEGTARE